MHAIGGTVGRWQCAVGQWPPTREPTPARNGKQGHRRSQALGEATAAPAAAICTCHRASKSSTPMTQIVELQGVAVETVDANTPVAEGVPLDNLAKAKQKTTENAGVSSGSNAGCFAM